MEAFNPYDTSELADPHERLAEVRARCPVAEFLPGMFYVARRADALAVFRDPATFVQAGFNPLDTSERHPDDLMLGELDPPLHTKKRALDMTALAPSKVAGAEPYIRALAAELVDRFAGNGKAELVAELALPLPARVITHMIGVPEEDSAQFRHWSDTRLLGLNPDAPDDLKAAAADADEHFRAYLLELIDARRTTEAPPDDLVTRMVRYRDEDGSAFSDRAIVTEIMNVIIGGNETTTYLIANLLHELCREPDRYRRVRDDRSLLAGAIEESLRHDSPVDVLFRRCTRDTTIGDTRVPAGAVVALGLVSANRDEAAHADPNTFDLDRPAAERRHLAFGNGIHFCLGAPLARLEATCALEALFDRIPALDLAPGFVHERNEYFMLRGPQRLDVVFAS